VRVIEIQFRNCVFRYFPEARYCETVFPDGTKVPAAPQDTDEYRAKSAAMGYGDPFDMCVHHEFLHTSICEAAGLEYSPALRAVALGLNERHDAEEDMVMEFQARLMRLLNASRTT
jgi:hypothetical protein